MGKITDEIMSAENKAAQKEHKENAFQAYLEQPTTKFILSYIPEGRDADAVRTALRGSFDVGYDAGAGWILTDFLKMLMGKGGPFGKREG